MEKIQVLVKNPFANHLVIQNVIPSFWSDDCLYPDDDFSLSTLFKASEPVGFSPYLFLSPQIAFSLTLLEKGKSTYVRGAGALGSVAVMMTTGVQVVHEEDTKKFNAYLEEYLPLKSDNQTKEFAQVLTFNSGIDSDLWKQLPVGGFYILAGEKGAIKANPPGEFEAFGRIWPVGMATEFGWTFTDEETGLKNFEVMKLKKLS